MNPGSCASSEMQITLQVLSINYRAWASHWSCRENRSLAPINFNGVWTPNSLSLFENQNHSFFRNIRGQVKCLDSEILTTLASAELGALPQALVCLPCAIHRIQGGSRE